MMNASKSSTANVWRVVLISIIAGAILTSLWSFKFTDSTIGDNIANTALGYDAKATPIAGSLAGALFAFITGLAGTFTACNICVFSAIAPLAAEKRSLGKVLQPMLYLAIGLFVVAGIYGAIGAFLGGNLPQLSSARLGDPQTGFPIRLIQSAVVFVIIGTIFVFWGLAAVGLVKNPFAGFAARHPNAQLYLMGALIGGFMIGRPFPLFRKMFEFAASTHNPLYGSLAFILSGTGNILIMLAMFLLLTYGTGGRFERWLQSEPSRIQTLTAVALIAGGTFFITYWGLRVPANFGIGWYPFISW